jgi:hypothetical protein
LRPRARARFSSQEKSTWICTRRLPSSTNGATSIPASASHDAIPAKNTMVPAAKTMELARLTRTSGAMIAIRLRT